MSIFSSSCLFDIEAQFNSDLVICSFSVDALINTFVPDVLSDG